MLDPEFDIGIYLIFHINIIVMLNKKQVNIVKRMLCSFMNDPVLHKSVEHLHPISLIGMPIRILIESQESKSMSPNAESPKFLP